MHISNRRSVFEKLRSVAAPAGKEAKMANVPSQLFSVPLHTPLQCLCLI